MLFNKKLKKLFFIFFLVSGVQFSFAQNIEQPESIIDTFDISKNLKIIYYDFEQSVEKIKTTAQTPASLFLKMLLTKRFYNVKIVSTPETLFENQKLLKNKENKMENNLSFPLASYLVLISKKKTASENSEFIPIHGNPVKIVSSGKKLKVVVVLKGSDSITPEQDVESYAIVYLDKNKIGITEQKLLSQPKTLEFEVSYEKHLLKLEIYIQNNYRKAWTRLKNIEQPPQKYFVPQEGVDVLYLLITYSPDDKLNRYTFEGSFNK